MEDYTNRLNRRLFFSKIRQTVCALAIAPQIAFGTTRPKFKPLAPGKNLTLEEQYCLWYRMKCARIDAGTITDYGIRMLSKEQLDLLFRKDTP